MTFAHDYIFYYSVIEVYFTYKLMFSSIFVRILVISSYFSIFFKKYMLGEFFSNSSFYIC